MSYVTYVEKMFWPTRLALFYPYLESLPGWWVAGSVLILMGISAAVIRAAVGYPYHPVGWLWYLGTLVPVIGLIQAGTQRMADRFTYVPLIGPFIMIGWGIPDLLARWPSRYRNLPNLALAPATGLVAVACAIAARVQVEYWRSGIVLWTHTLEVTSNNIVAQTNMGIALQVLANAEMRPRSNV